MYRVKADLMRPEDGACVINVAGEEVMRCESLQQAAVVRNALNSELAAAEKRVAELEAERDELLWAAQWLLSGRGRIRYFGNDDDTYAKQREQGRNNERAEQIVTRAAFTGNAS